MAHWAMANKWRRPARGTLWTASSREVGTQECASVTLTILRLGFGHLGHAGSDMYSHTPGSQLSDSSCLEQLRPVSSFRYRFSHPSSNRLSWHCRPARRVIRTITTQPPCRGGLRCPSVPCDLLHGSTDYLSWVSALTYGYGLARF